MSGEDEKNDEKRSSGISHRKSYFRSASWSDRSPNKPVIPKGQGNSRGNRSCLPPLQPLAIARRPAEEWPRAGSDDLGIWQNPQTPRFAEAENLAKEFEFKRDKLAYFEKECSKIAEHIYLGSEAVAKNREILREKGITHVLNCVGFVCPEYFRSEFAYKTLWLRDSPSEDITSVLYNVFDYLEDVREQGGRVFVHCCQGVSRSTSLVIAYLMWRDGKSFEDAFQHVKAARGVTNPNMGFACQLLQCQKRVHAVPASPESVLRMYRMAPHSSYDPLNLVPKMVPQPHALDSRGAYVVHVPSHVFVWIGRRCGTVLSNQAKVAANQVIRYEKAQGPPLVVREDEEPDDFWSSCGMRPPPGGSNERRVAEYDDDFEVVDKAVAGGVVPPFSGSVTRIPARENNWGRLKQKVKELVASSQMKVELLPHGFKDAGQLPALGDASPAENTRKAAHKSPYSSPSSETANSPSSSTWSEFSGVPSTQTSPSGAKLLPSHEDWPAPEKPAFRSISERRGSAPPPIILPPEDNHRKISKQVQRSRSFALPEHEEQDSTMPSADLSIHSLANDIAEASKVAEIALYEWPAMKRTALPPGSFPDSERMYLLVSGESAKAYMWLGKNSLSAEAKRELTVAIRKHISMPMEVVREGEETSAFLSLLQFEANV